MARGVEAVLTPGHTPGSLPVVVTSTGERLVLLGDVITCPVQLAESGWRSMGDVDPSLAARTRCRLWQLLREEGTTGVGAHFPQLAAGRVAAPGRWGEMDRSTSPSGGVRPSVG